MVAPHVGAWIETIYRKCAIFRDGVAPHVGAWIETHNAYPYPALLMSLPMWERGLNLVGIVDAYLRYSRSTCGSVD